MPVADHDSSEDELQLPLSHATRVAVDEVGQVESYYLSLLIEAARPHTLLQSSILETRRRLQRLDMFWKPSGLKAVYSSRPYAILGNLRWMQFCSLVLGCLGLGYSFFILWSLKRADNIPAYPYYKLEVLERRDNSTYSWQRSRGSGVHHFGLLSDSAVIVCDRTNLLNSSISEDGHTIIRVRSGSQTTQSGGSDLYEENDIKRGWYLITSTDPDSSGQDPVRFNLLGSHNLISWEFVASPVFRYVGQQLEYVDSSFDMPLERGLEVRWIVTAPWPSYVTTFGLFHMMGWLFMGMRVMVYLEAADYVHVPIFFAFFNTGILSGIGAVGYASLTPEYGSGKNHNKALYRAGPFTDVFLPQAPFQADVMFWSGSCILFLMTSFLHWKFPRIPELMIWFVAFGTFAFQVVALASSKAALRSGPISFLLPIPMIVLSVFVFLVHYRVVSKARNSCYARKRFLDTEWAKFVQTPAGQGIEMLDQTVAKIVSDVAMRGTHAARQYCVILVNSAGGTGDANSKGLHQRNVDPKNALPIQLSQSVLNNKEDITHTHSPAKPLSSHQSHYSFDSHIVEVAPEIEDDTTGSLHSVGSRRRAQPTNPSKPPVDVHQKLSECSLQRNGQHWAPGVAGAKWDYSKMLHFMRMENLVSIPDYSHPIKSLDHLYSQATLVRGSFFPLVVSYAAQYKGMFPLRNQAGFGTITRPWNTSNTQKFKLGGLKRIERCIDKIDMSYDGDVSRLLDVCREMLVFENLNDLNACLAAIGNDPMITIVRIRSTMCEAGGEPAVPTGYPFVSLNMQIRTEETLRLCVNRHVCELLLILKTFASDIVHKHLHYIWYRSCVRSYLWAPLSTLHTLKSKSKIQQAAWWSHHPDRENNETVPDYLKPIDEEPEDLMNEGSNQLGVQEEQLPNQESQPVSYQTAALLDVPKGSSIKTSWGVEVDGEMRELLEVVCRMAALGYSDLLDCSISSSHWLAFNKLAGVKILYSQRPVTAASVNLRVTYTALLIGTIACLGAAWNHYTPTTFQFKFPGLSYETDYTPYVGKSFRHFKFVNIKTRTGDDATSPGIEGFGPFVSKRSPSCVTHLDIESSDISRQKILDTVVSEGNTMSISFDQAEPFHGWQIHFGNGSLADSSRFKIFASNATGNAKDIPQDGWNEVGGSYYLVGKRGTIAITQMEDHFNVLLPDVPGQIFNQLRQTKLSPSFDSDFVKGVGLIFFGIFGRLRMAERAILSLRIAFFINLIMVFDAFTSISNLRWSLASTSLQIIIAVLYWTITFERQLKVLLALLFICIVVEASLQTKSEVDRCGPALQMGRTYIEYILYLAFLLMWVIVHKVSDIAAILGLKGVETKVDAHDQQVWQMEGDGKFAKFTSVGQFVAALGMEVMTSIKKDGEEVSETPFVLQLNRTWCIYRRIKGLKSYRVAPQHLRHDMHGEDLLFLSLNIMPLPNTLNPKSKIQSLDQLYMQAILVDLLLRRKVQEWAKQTEGFFPLFDDCKPCSMEKQASDGRYVKWNDVLNDDNAKASIKWPELKDHQKVVERYMTSQNKDMSQLIDLSRQSIYFNRMSDLSYCLAAIITDKMVKVERVASSMTSDCVAKKRGKRYMVINLRICSELAGILGCETHLCEVRLVRSFML